MKWKRRDLELYFLIPWIFLHLCLVTWRFWYENPDSTCIQVSHRSTSHRVGCVCSLALTLAALTPHVPKSHTALHTMWTVYAPWHSPWPWGPEHWAQSEHKGSLRSLHRSRATKVKDKGSSPGLEPGQDRASYFQCGTPLGSRVLSLWDFLPNSCCVGCRCLWEERETSKNKQKNGLRALRANGMGTNLTSGS